VSIPTAIAIYLTLWWTTLFAILPLGVRSHAEEGRPVPGGGDPSSPVDPKLGRKFFTTSWLSAILFAVLWLTLRFHLITLPRFPS
jgi:predicted secreted protein